MLKPMLHSRNSDGAGELNIGEVKNAALDALIDKLEGEMNPVERQKMINSAVKLIHDEVFVIPLHTQVIPWASQKNISVVHRANNVLGLIWVKVN
jgi:peptide/nickel transport system substrate-binding protein